MSTEQILHIEVDSLEATLQLAESIGRNCRGGEIIEFVSDVGGGKTTFVRGFAKGAGSEDEVSSPSFTITREYDAGDKYIYHYDFYRLHEPGLVAAQLAEALEDAQSIVLIEWADIVRGVLDRPRINIAITSTGETSREFKITYPESLAYVLAGVGFDATGGGAA